MADFSTDVVIYGANVGGIIAAKILDERYGLNVRLLNPDSDRWGGVTTGGLGALDLNAGDVPASVGGITLQFLQELQAQIGSPSITNRVEPHDIANVINKTAVAGVGWRLGARRTSHSNRSVASVQKTGSRIVSLTTVNGDKFSADHFIDMSQEGDLMAAAGLPYSFGREAASTYGEVFIDGESGGIMNGQAGYPARIGQIAANMLDSNGQRLYGVGPIPKAIDGLQAAYQSSQHITFRLALTQDATLKVAFTAPTGYDASRYTALLNAVVAGGKTALCTIGSNAGVLVGYQYYRSDGKVVCDANVNGAHSMGFYEAMFGSEEWQHAWIEGNTGDPATRDARRATMKQRLYEYVAGMLYFLANDASVPSALKTDAASWGYSNAEFNGSNAKSSFGQTYFPHTAYVREGRRLVGQKVMTVFDVVSGATQDDPICSYRYGTDGHTARKYARPANVAQAESEGGFNGLETPADYYQIPWRALVPVPGIADNIACIGGPSCSHLAWGAIRLDPCLWMMAEAAAHGIGRAEALGTTVARVGYAEVRAALLAEGSKLNA